ncbi:MAG: zinc-ribbon domain-containing protein [Pyrinomonadaceae bacterium]|nr:zinc-ribbon domain-containing protein [Pyrinomonadaceae bacterium]
MIVTCSKCQTRLQLDEAKIPAIPFNVRCPKCSHANNVQPLAGNSASPLNNTKSATDTITEDASPLARARLEHAASAPVFRAEASDKNSTAKQESVINAEDVVRLLSALLQRGAATAGAGEGESSFFGRSWEQRRALVCVAPAHKETVARALSESRYEVFVAADTAQAIKRMREDQMSVLVLDPEFDQIEQGAAFINREIAQLRPVERRRLFIVQLSPTARTDDAHAAFVNHVNLMVNTKDAAEMSSVLERAVRDFGELYRDFNKALAASST